MQLTATSGLGLLQAARRGRSMFFCFLVLVLAWLDREIAHPALPRRPRAVLVKVEKCVEVEALQVLAVSPSPGTGDWDLCMR